MSKSYIIKAFDVNEAFDKGVRYLLEHGVVEDSRNGKVLVAPGPVITEYQHPTSRMLFNEARDANPFFHIMECIWMLAGRNDAEWISQFNSGMSQYAEADGTFHGAYGFRWRNHFNQDQLLSMVNLLRNDPNTRRAVLAMHDTNVDLTNEVKDRPCNTQIVFDLRGGVLNMNVFNRSNDAVWGAYGANAVHMSFLQEWLAGALNVPVGTYYQTSHNLHLYYEWDRVKSCIADTSPKYDNGFLTELMLHSTPLFDPNNENEDKHVEFLIDCENFCNGIMNFTNPWFYYVADPMLDVWKMRKAGADIIKQFEACAEIQDTALNLACIDWIQRREAAKNAK